MPDLEPIPFVARLLRHRRPTASVSVEQMSSGELSPPVTRAVRRPRVLLVARDRRYRAVASTLLSQRGNTVLDCRWGEDVAEVAARERIDVVLFDASASLTATARDAARLAALEPAIGIVAVSEEAQPGLAALPVLPKWTAFDEVLAAIERACRASAHDGATSGAR